MSVKPVGANYPAEGTPVLPANNGKVLSASTTTGAQVVRNVILSTVDPTAGDGADVDVWLKYTP
jgi:hypothetical protein